MTSNQRFPFPTYLICYTTTIEFAKHLGLGPVVYPSRAREPNPLTHVSTIVRIIDRNCRLVSSRSFTIMGFQKSGGACRLGFRVMTSKDRRRLEIVLHL
jgi:hypothetical protein